MIPKTEYQIGCMLISLAWVIGLFIAGYLDYFVIYCIASMLVAAIAITLSAMSNKYSSLDDKSYFDDK